MLLWCLHIWPHLTEVCICPWLSSTDTVSCKCRCLRKVIMIYLVHIEPVVILLCVWYLEVIPAVGTTLVQVRQAQCRLNQGVSPFSTAKHRSRICLSTTTFGWSIFTKYLFHQQVLPLQKLKCFAEVWPFWSQIGEGNWFCPVLTTWHELCKSCAEIHALPTLQLRFEPALSYFSGKFPSCLIAFFFFFPHPKELYLPSLN